MAVTIIPAADQRAVPSDDMPHFMATYHRAVALQEDPWLTTPQVEIHLGKRGTERGQPEWLEHTLIVTYPSGNKMVVGAIERYVGAGSEFHS